MNKRQWKKRFKRINGFNPPKYFTRAQIRKCCSNNIKYNAVYGPIYKMDHDFYKITGIKKDELDFLDKNSREGLMFKEAILQDEGEITLVYTARSEADK